MRDFTFTFGGVDFYEKYGILLEKTKDNLIPDLRERKVEIPDRSGAYDYGAKYYNERMVELTCISLRSLSREEMRELAYDLSGKKQLRTWHEPDKYYMAQLFSTDAIEYIGRMGNRFGLPFKCEPFAYGEQKTVRFTNEAPLKYAGTAETPVRITITNTGETDMEGIIIKVRKVINQ